MKKLGRPFSETPRTIKTTIRLTEKEKKQLDLIAKRENTKVAYIIRNAILKEIEKRK